MNRSHCNPRTWLLPIDFEGLQLPTWRNGCCPPAAAIGGRRPERVGGAQTLAFEEFVRILDGRVLTVAGGAGLEPWAGDVGAASLCSLGDE